MAQDDKYLPGHPRTKLIRDVRRHLSHYGIRPTRFDLWKMTWAWAHEIAISYWKTTWPSSTEIATQYLALLLLEMKASCGLRLPYRHAEKMPASVRQQIAGSQALIAMQKSGKNHVTLLEGTLNEPAYDRD